MNTPEEIVPDPQKQHQISFVNQNTSLNEYMKNLENRKETLKKSLNKCVQVEDKTQNFIKNVRELFKILDTKEEDNKGKMFHPTIMKSCNSSDIIKLGKILPEIKNFLNMEETKDETF